MSINIKMKDYELIIEIRYTIIGSHTRDEARALLNLILEAVIPQLVMEAEG